MMRRAPWLSLAVLLAGIGLAIRPMLATLHGTWNDVYGAHSHGYLVVALALWFAVRAWRAPPPAVPGRPVWTALPVLLLLLGLALLAEAMFIGPSRSGLLPPLLLAAIALCLGAGALRRLAWPVLFLFFALPVWVPLNEPLRQLTTVVSQAMVRASGIPVHVEGSFVHLAEGSFEIASGCSGLNYLVAALTLAAVYCTLYLRTTRARVILILVAAMAALLANWLRVTSLILIGHFTEMQHYLIRVEHLWYGWALFLLIMIPVYLFGAWLEGRETGWRQAGLRWPAVPAPVAGALRAGTWIACGAMLAVVGAAQMAGAASAPAQAAPGPEGIPGSDVDAFVSGWAPRFQGARELRRRSAAAEVPVEFYVAYYPQQHREARLSWPSNTLTGGRWRATATGAMRDGADGRAWLESRGVLADREHLLWMRYEVAGAKAWSKPTLRAREAQGMLKGRRDASAVALMAPCVPDCDTARRSISATLAGE